MHIFHSPPFIQAPEPSVATIGNFDGMHRGHQVLLKQVIEYAKAHQLKSSVILFEPQPLELLQLKRAPARLQALSDKLLFLDKFGIDQVFLIHFTQEFSTLTAKEFVTQFLLQRFAVRALFVGANFCFGHQRAGNLSFLQQYAQQGLLDVFPVPLLTRDQTPFSSTEVRRALEAGNFKKAEELLGRAFVITGRVMHGAKIGRLLEFPTINLALRRRVSPLHGIYAVRVLTQEQVFFGVASIGVRPTVCQTGQWLLEVFLFSQDSIDLYSCRVSVEFVAKIRDEEHFESLAALQKQIAKDVEAVRIYFGIV
jgi:riboflavin kinase / FMN adenylyltransferase